MTEDQLAKNVMFKVEDQPCPSNTLNKAAQSLPGSLSLRPSCSKFSIGVTGVWTNVPIPAGTRFGPVMGTVCPPEDAQNVNLDKKYFWRIYDRPNSQVQFIVDGKDVTKANWMRHVQPCYYAEAQNLIAYQDGQAIYFMTVRQISQDEELFVWYSYDFAKRIKVRTFVDEVPEPVPAPRPVQPVLHSNSLPQVARYGSIVTTYPQHQIDVSVSVLLVFFIFIFWQEGLLRALK